MAQKGGKKDSAQEAYEQLRADTKRGTPRRLYAFWGEEKYLMETSIKALRALIPQGTEEFNHTRLNAASFSAAALEEAVNTLPAFSELTLTEVWDVDLSRLTEESRSELERILGDIPDSATVVFVFDTVEFKLDGRSRSGAALKGLFTQVEFQRQSPDKLVRWLEKQFAAAGKRIDRRAAEQLVVMTGSSMTAMKMEVGKLASCSDAPEITCTDVERLVTPVLEAAVYELTDAVLRGDNERAARKLWELFQNGEPPQRILYSLSAKLRQTLAAKILSETGGSIRDLMALCDIRYEFQARSVMSAAKRISEDRCAAMVRAASRTAQSLNSTSQSGVELLEELLVRLIWTMEGTA